MDVESSWVLKSIKLFLVAISLIVFFGALSIFYLSTTQYTFSSTNLHPSLIPCYTNLTSNIQEATSVFGFDFFLITLQPFMITLLALNIACYVSNLDNGIILLFAFINFIGIGLFAILKLVYYTFASFNCSEYWFCFSPCESIWPSVIPSVEFYISYSADLITLLLALISLVGVLLFTVIRKSIKEDTLLSNTFLPRIGTKIYNKISQIDTDASD